MRGCVEFSEVEAFRGDRELGAGGSSGQGLGRPGLGGQEPERGGAGRTEPALPPTAHEPVGPGAWTRAGRRAWRERGGIQMERGLRRRVREQLEGDGQDPSVRKSHTELPVLRPSASVRHPVPHVPRAPAPTVPSTSSQTETLPLRVFTRQLLLAES